METIQNFSETFTGSDPTDQHNAAESALPQGLEDQTAESHLSSETPTTPEPESEIGPDGSIKIPLDQIFIDGSIFPRAALDHYTVQQYAAALIRGEQLPPITVEAVKENEYRVLAGVHRFEAYHLRQKMYAGKLVGDFYDDPLPIISEKELDTIPCLIDTIPPDMHPMVFAMQDNLKHGKPLTSEDYKKIARQVYQDNPGAPIQELAKLIKIGRKVFKTYVSDLVEDFEQEKEDLIVELHAQGIPEAKISQELKGKFPKAKGVSQSQISEVLLKKDLSENRDENEDDATADITDGSQAGTPQEEPAGDDPQGAEGTESPEATTKPVELQVVCGNQSDTIMILGLQSLPPHLQEKLRTEVEKLVKQVQEEKLAIEEQEDQAGEAHSERQDEAPDTPGKAYSEHQDETPDAPEIAKPANQSSSGKATAHKIRPAIQPTKGSRPLNYSG